MQRQDVVWAATVGFGINATLSVIFPIANRTYLELAIYEQGAKATAGTRSHAAILSLLLNGRPVTYDNSGCRGLLFWLPATQSAESRVFYSVDEERFPAG